MSINTSLAPRPNLSVQISEEQAQSLSPILPSYKVHLILRTIFIKILSNFKQLYFLTLIEYFLIFF